MNIDQAVNLAHELLRREGLSDWSVRTDRAVRRAGMCSEKQKFISLSRKLIPLYDDGTVRDIILHEIAHALVGAKAGHGPRWKAEARRLGARPRARLAKDLPQVPAPWVGTCPSGHTIERFRRPSRSISCAQCSRKYNPRYSFTWDYRG